MGFILALILAAAVALLAVLNVGNELTLELAPGYRLVEVQAWQLIIVTGLSAAVVAWVCGLKPLLQLKRQVRQREKELAAANERLKSAHDSLQEYETRMHEFALKVVQMAHRQLPPSTEQAAEELAESLAQAAPETEAVTAPPEADAPETEEPETAVEAADEGSGAKRGDSVPDRAEPVDDDDYI